MLRLACKNVAVFALIAGIVFRALVPIGYMPATAESRLLFELCPDQFPAGFVMPGAADSGHQHHHDSVDAEQADHCQVGHLLFSAIAVDQADLDVDSIDVASDYRITRPSAVDRLKPLAYQSRAPPS